MALKGVVQARKPAGGKFPVVKIRKVEFEGLKNASGSFNEAIAWVRRKMAERGLDYGLPFASWRDRRGNLCHQNFLSARHSQ